MSAPRPLVLNVDDRDDVRSLRTRALRHGGFQVREAATGHEALRLVASERPDVVLLDARPPDIDGLDVCRRIKADPATSGIPVLQVSAVDADREGRVAALENGADAFLPEPVDVSELVATVRALLRTRRAYARLRESENLVQMLFQAAPTLMVGLDREGRIVLFNRACERLTGYRQDEVLGRPLLDLTPPGWRERAAALLASGGPGVLAPSHEQPWLTRDGRERLIEWRCFMTTDAHGDAFTFGVGHDVTERHQANARQFLQFSVTRSLAEARSMDEAARALLEAVCMILGWDVGELWSVDGQAGLARLAASWTGWTEAATSLAQGEMPSCRPGEGLPGQAWQAGKPVWMRDVQTEPAFRRKEAARCAGLRTAVAFPILVAGEVLAVLVFLSRTSRDVDPLLLATLADIGEQVGQFIQRTRADAALRASETRLRLALDAAGMGWWEWDLRTGQAVWSPELDALLGLRPGGLSPKAFLERVHPDDRLLVLEALHRALAGSGDYAAGFRIVGAEGPPRWASVRARITRDEAGRPVRMIGIGHDVTAARRDEEERAQLAELGRVLNESLELDVLLPRVAEAARRLCRADAARVSFRDSAVYRCDADGVHRYADPALRLDPSVGMGGYVLTTGRAIRTDDYAGDSRFTPLPAERGRALAPGIVAALAVPIPGPERADGVLGVYNRTARPFTDRDEATLRRLADYAAVACRNAGMYRAAQTARVEAEQARRRAVTILERITDAFAALDREWRFVYLNGSAERLAGRRREELIGKVVWEEFPDAADTRFATEGRRALTEQTTVEFEEYYAPRGLRLQVRAYPSDDGLSVYVRDVTERRRSEALDQAEKRVLELLAKGAPLGQGLDVLTEAIEEQSSGMLASILLVDPDGARLRHAAGPSLPADYRAAIDGVAIGPAAGSSGTAAYRRTAVVVTDIASDPLWDDFRDVALAHGLRACWSTPILSGQEALLGTFALYYREPRAPDAGDLWLIERAAGIARLAIERRRAEEELAVLLARAEAARAEAETANLAKDRFLAALSHELRNPLASIASAVASLGRMGAERPDAARLHEIIRRQARTLGRLLDDLLDVTRLAFGKLALQQERLDLREVAGRCIEALEASGRLTAHPVTAETDGAPVPVQGDRVRLEQVLGNLLDNAVKYSPAGRPIRVEVRRADRHALLVVRDAGIGLDPEVLERIFEPFTQLGERPGGGLGLGLAVVRGLVRQHGGRIVARSAGKGHGSEFEVRLPLADSADVPTPAP